MTDGWREGESVFDKAARLAAQRQADIDRSERLASREAGALLRAELDVLHQVLEERGATVGSKANGASVRVERQGGGGMMAVIFEDRASTTIGWDESRTFRESALIVKGWPGAYSFAGYGRHGDQKPTSERWFARDVVAGEWAWREIARENHKEQVFTSTEQLADSILSELLDRAFAPPEARNEYRPYTR